MAKPPPPTGSRSPRRPARGAGWPRRAAGAGAGAVACCALGAALACARPEGPPITRAAVDRDRATRAELEAAIAEDHRALAVLIASEHFEDEQAIYADPEVGLLAERLIERTRRLAELAETDVLAPVTPEAP